mgnify:CR=1 FL=1
MNPVAEILTRHGYVPAAESIDAALADRACNYDLYVYWTETGEMPYGIMKARIGDPDEWMAERMCKLLP